MSSESLSIQIEAVAEAAERLRAALAGREEPLAPGLLSHSAADGALRRVARFVSGCDEAIGGQAAVIANTVNLLALDVALADRVEAVTDSSMRAV